MRRGCAAIAQRGDHLGFLRGLRTVWTRYYCGAPDRVETLVNHPGDFNAVPSALSADLDRPVEGHPDRGEAGYGLRRPDAGSELGSTPFELAMRQEQRRVDDDHEERELTVLGRKGRDPGRFIPSGPGLCVRALDGS
jgi:hypothetical protein